MRLTGAVSGIEYPATDILVNPRYRCRHTYCHSFHDLSVVRIVGHKLIQARLLEHVISTTRTHLLSST